MNNILIRMNSRRMWFRSALVFGIGVLASCGTAISPSPHEKPASLVGLWVSDQPYEIHDGPTSSDQVTTVFRTTVQFYDTYHTEGTGVWGSKTGWIIQYLQVKSGATPLQNSPSTFLRETDYPVYFQYVSGPNHTPAWMTYIYFRWTLSDDGTLIMKPASSLGDTSDMQTFEGSVSTNVDVTSQEPITSRTGTDSLSPLGEWVMNKDIDRWIPVAGSIWANTVYFEDVHKFPLGTLEVGDWHGFEVDASGQQSMRGPLSIVNQAFGSSLFTFFTNQELEFHRQR